MLSIIRKSQLLTSLNVISCWNHFSVLNHEQAFKPKPELLEMNNREWQDITEDVFQKVFKDSPVKRTKFSGLKRNIEFLKNS